MKQQTIMWTALPNGIAGSERAGGARLRISVFISPKLQTDEGGKPTLSQFPDFVGWTTLSQNIQFQVRFEGGPTVAATRATPNPDPPEPDLWTAIFTPTTYVKPYQFPGIVGRTIHSFPVSNVLSHIRDMYSSVAIDSPTQIPRTTLGDQTVPGLQALARDIVLPPAQTAAIQQQMSAHVASSPVKAVRSQRFNATTKLRVNPASPASRTGGAAFQVANTPQATLDFAQLQMYHAGMTGKRMPMPTPRELADAIDFHQMHASLGSYSRLMRRLGLIIDLEVPLTANTPRTGAVQVIPTVTLQMTTTQVTPKTAYAITEARFLARPRPDGEEIANGMLRLNDEDLYEVIQIDVDGAATKTVELATRLARPGSHKASVPALRSAGISVAKADRAFHLAKTLQMAANFHTAVQTQERTSTPADVTLFTEDITRGFRVDIMDERDGKWRSLCQRVGTYVVRSAGKTLSLEDEGWISTAATQPADKADADIYVHEAMFRWQGWSLCAPRPGRAIKSEGVPDMDPTRFGLDAYFMARPGSLPRLRFGHSYRVRARVVDLAGNSLSPDDTDASQASDPVTYFRHEPLVAPAVIPRKDIKGSPGESVERLVIRTNNDSPAKDSQVAGDVEDRHIAPPKTSELMAETHSMFDGPTAMKGDGATYNMIVNKDQSAANFYDVDQLALPYLPDPLAFSTVGRFSPTVYTPAGQPLPAPMEMNIPFDGTWPDLRPFRLRIYEPAGPGATPNWDAANRVLTLPLPKAEVAQIVLSTGLKPADVPTMGMWRWTAERVVAPAARKARLQPEELLDVHRNLHVISKLPALSAKVALPATDLKLINDLHVNIVAGRNWMLTPPRTLTLVHAVAQPLVIPNFQTLTASRNYGNTFAYLDDAFPISGRSTSKLDIEAAWEEPVDDLVEATPSTRKGKQHVGEVPIQPIDTTARLAYPAPPKAAAPAGAAMVMMAAVGPRLERTRHEFGDTKYRRVTYTATATSRFREYFPADDIAAGRIKLTRESNPVAIDVLSSARPATPRVLYTIPTFAWSRNDPKEPAIVSTRSGGGLRVYLERPWYSSGDGELLGVVLHQAPRAVVPTAMLMLNTAVPEKLKPHVTLWGADPIWRAPTTSASPTPAQFRRAVATESDLTLDEMPDAQVTVVGHAVEYDPDRQLWFCDIDLAPGTAYYPFVRLALARYQPKSLKTTGRDCKLSRVVLAEISQLVPGRVAVCSFDPANPTLVNTAVTGRTYSESSAARGGSQIEVTVERRRPGVEGDLGWVPTDVAPVVLKPGQTREDPTVTLWTGTVALPTARTPNTYRLVFREYEAFLADRQGGAVPAAMVAIRPTERRVVYADAVEI